MGVYVSADMMQLWKDEDPRFFTLNIIEPISLCMAMRSFRVAIRVARQKLLEMFRVLSIAPDED